MRRYVAGGGSECIGNAVACPTHSSPGSAPPPYWTPAFSRRCFLTPRALEAVYRGDNTREASRGPPCPISAGKPALNVDRVRSLHGLGVAGGAMPDYRIYTVTSGGRIHGVPTVISCGDDQEATEKAKQLVQDEAIDVWERERHVARISRKGAQEPSSQREGRRRRHSSSWNG